MASKENIENWITQVEELRILTKYFDLLEKHHMEILGLKDTISKIINTIDGCNGGWHRISKTEYRPVENIQIEELI